MTKSIQEIEQKLLDLHLEHFIQKAYEQGVRDAQQKYAIPAILTRSEAMDFLKVSSTKMNELMSRPDFPVSREFGIKIPTHMLMKWIETNTRWIEKNTNYYSKEAM